MSLIFTQGRPGRRAWRLPALDVPKKNAVPKSCLREAPADLPEVSELEVVRHFTNLSRKNFSVDTQFYPLGSCTMKYNPRVNEMLAGMPEFTNIHPGLSLTKEGEKHMQGTLGILYEHEQRINELFGFSAATFQPMAGAHGEFTGISLIAAWHRDHGTWDQRKVMLIPDSAHGTNPASAIQAGFIVREIKTGSKGEVSLEDLKANLDEHTAGMMLTCPNTAGFYNDGLSEMCALIHEAGALIYCDGANSNAIIGRVRPGDIGFDAMHLNVHKTLATPHGGGGPGDGPVMCNDTLKPYLPVPRVRKDAEGVFSLDWNQPKSIGKVMPFMGNFGVLLRSCAYLCRLGREGVRRVADNAVLNANYLRVLLTPGYDQTVSDMCMHECVFSASRQVKLGVHALDISKALIDRGFHPPTMYFPLIVPEALMIEPTETESKEMLDSFAKAMLDIAKVAETDPQQLHDAPITMPIGRLDETEAARHPQLRYVPEA
ncbi:MAG: aminomethyl-transferring glycine dehydrogenase subunit GcvPB [Lentisphaeria bacterium]